MENCLSDVDVELLMNDRMERERDDIVTENSAYFKNNIVELVLKVLKYQTQ